MMGKLTVEQVSQILKDADASSKRANLERLDLSGLDLSNVDFGGADLFRANLAGSNLSGANLEGSNLISSNLKGADLTEANLKGSNLTGANLRGAKLFRAILQGAFYREADLSGAFINGAMLEGADVLGTNLLKSESKLERTNEQLDNSISDKDSGSWIDWLQSDNGKCDLHSIQRIMPMADKGAGNLTSDEVIELFGTLLTNLEQRYPIILFPLEFLAIMVNGINDEDVQVPPPKLLKLPRQPSQPSRSNQNFRKVLNYDGIVDFVISVFYYVGIGAFTYVPVFFAFTWVFWVLDFFDYFLIFIIYVYPTTYVSLVLFFCFRNAYFIKEISYEVEKPISEYDADILKYQESLRSYNIELMNVNEQNKRISEEFEGEYNTFLKAHKYSKLIDDIASRGEVIGLQKNDVRKAGRTEKFFEEYLFNKFGDSVNANQGILFGHFYPDFVFVHPSLKFHIDIEIDEPYVMSSRDPIHCVDNDENRNRYFLELNWIVVRFSEKQIIYYPEICVNVISNIIDFIEKRALNSVLPDTSQTNLSTDLDYRDVLIGSALADMDYEDDDFSKPSFYTKQWTEKKARKWARNNYREFHFEKSKFNSGFT